MDQKKQVAIVLTAMILGGIGYHVGSREIRAAYEQHRRKIIAEAMASGDLAGVSFCPTGWPKTDKRAK